MFIELFENIKWTPEEIREVALMYNNTNKFIHDHEGLGSKAYYAAKRYNKTHPGFLDDICSHMEELNIKWTPEKIREVALKYNTGSEFRCDKEGLGLKAYQAAKRYNKTHPGFLDDISSHMKENYHWTPEKIREVALMYNNTNKFIHDNEGLGSKAYDAALQYNKTHPGFLDDICSHMERVGNLVDRGIYAYEFILENGEKYVYVGLTCNFDRRNREHTIILDEDIDKKEESSVLKFIKKLNKENIKYEYNFKIIHEYMPYKEASKKEGKTLDRYIENGWIPLNVAKTGGLGGNFKIWTPEKIREVALIYNSKWKFRCDNKEGLGSKAYQAASKYDKTHPGFLDDICSHMEKKCHWTPEKIREVASICNTKNEFIHDHHKAYDAALQYNKTHPGFYNDICSHMEKSKPKVKNIENSSIQYDIQQDQQILESIIDKYGQDDVAKYLNSLNENFTNVFDSSLIDYSKDLEKQDAEFLAYSTNLINSFKQYMENSGYDNLNENLRYNRPDEYEIDWEELSYTDIKQFNKLNEKFRIWCDKYLRSTEAFKESIWYYIITEIDKDQKESRIFNLNNIDNVISKYFNKTDLSILRKAYNEFIEEHIDDDEMFTNKFNTAW